jgi:hypothetical protein
MRRCEFTGLIENGACTVVIGLMLTASTRLQRAWLSAYQKGQV